MVATIMDNAKPRILFCVTSSDWGGVQHFLLEISKIAQRNGHQVMIAAGEKGELEQKCNENGIQFAHLAHMKRSISPLGDLAAVYEIRKLLREYKPNIIHLNSSKMSIIGSIATKLESKIKKPLVIYRIGGWVFNERLPGWKRQTYLELEKWTATMKDIIVTVHPGDEELSHKEEIKPRDRVLTIANGIDLKDFDAKLKSREEARNILGIPQDEFIVGTIANYYPPKNLPWLLKTISNFKKDPTRYSLLATRFVIIGDGPDREKINNLHSELNLQNQVILAGRRTDASTLLSAFDIFILPSTKEGMPWTLLEAMAAHLPCIATNVGACKWMLKDNTGIILPVDDAAALEKTIQFLKNDKPVRHKLGENARRAVESRFTWESTRDKTLDLFNL